MRSDSRFQAAFDLDGTLFSSDKILARAYKTSIEALNIRRHTNFSAPKLNDILAQVGRPVWEIFRALFPGMTDDQRRECADGVLKELDLLIRAKKGRLFRGVKSMLAECQKSYELYLVSNCRRVYLEAVMETYGLEKYFADIRCNEDEPALSKKGILKRWMDSSPLEDSHRGVMIGDRSSDGEAAVYANVPWIGCDYGYGSAKLSTNELIGADVVVGSVPEIPAAIRRIIGS